MCNDIPRFQLLHLCPMGAILIDIDQNDTRMTHQPKDCRVKHLSSNQHMCNVFR